MWTPALGREVGKKMLKFSIYSENGDHKTIINEENEVTLSFYSQLLQIFSTIDYDKKVIHFSCTHQMNDEIKEKIKNLTARYENFNIKIKQFYSYFSNIPNSKYFCVFPETDFTVEQIMNIFESIRLLNQGCKFEDLDSKIKKSNDDFNEMFGSLVEQYEILVYSPRRKTIYGEKDKTNRICKYCKRSSSETTFHEEAHAISEALGNKTLISAEECDECNHLFSSTIEKDIFNYLKIFRVLYGKKGKKTIPELYFNNGIKLYYKKNVDVNGEKKDIAVFEDKKGTASLDENNNFNIPLELSENVNFMNIYRCLVKFAIAVLPMEIVNKLNRTIEWIKNIKNDSSILNLPKVAHLITSNAYYDQPEITIYKRKENGNRELPFLFCELKIEFFVFVYIIPFTDGDITDFSIEENYNNFWNFNKHYNRISSWVFNNFNCDESKPLIINLYIKANNT